MNMSINILVSGLEFEDTSADQFELRQYWDSVKAELCVNSTFMYAVYLDLAY